MSSTHSVSPVAHAGTRRVPTVADAWFGMATSVALAWLFNESHDRLAGPRAWATEPFWMGGMLAVAVLLTWLARSPRGATFRGGLWFGAAISLVAWLAMWIAAPTLGG